MPTDTPNLFAIYLGAGAIAGLCWSWWLIQQSNPHRWSTQKRDLYTQSILVTAIGTLAGGIIGGRIAYIWLHWSYYQSHSAEIWQIWAGGMDWTGSVWGAVIMLFLVCGLLDQSPREIANDLLPFFSWTITALWLASTTSHTYYGPPHAATWYTLEIADQTGRLLPRLPIHLTGALFTAISGSWLDSTVVVPMKKLKTEYFFLLQMIFLMGASFLRADPVPKVVSFPVDLVFATIYAIGLAISILASSWQRTNRRREV